jgi:hypothetical protein
MEHDSVKDGAVHVVPCNDLRDHTTVTECWCRPTETDGVWVHHSMDRREEYEPGGKEPH